MPEYPIVKRIQKGGEKALSLRLKILTLRDRFVILLKRGSAAQLSKNIQCYMENPDYSEGKRQ